MIKVLKKLLDYKLTYLIIGTLLASLFNYFSNVRLVEREYFYKIKSEKQEFVFELSQMLQKRIYNAEVFFWNVKNDARKSTILNSWERYKEITINWNEELPNYYFKLDIYFPPNEYVVKAHSEHLRSEFSFRNFLNKEIQLKIIPIHGQLVELKKLVLKDEKPTQKLLIKIEKDIERLHAKIANYAEALTKAIND